MTADPAHRPNILELCQLMVPVLMATLDELRSKDHKNQDEIRFLKEKLKYFEVTTLTGFRFNPTPT